MRLAFRTATTSLCLVLALAGCSQIREAVDDALSAALRSAASEALTQAAEQNGFPLAGEPDCQGGVKTETKSATISCTAQAQAGQPVNATITITNAGDSATCSGEMVIRIPNQAPITQKFTNCGG